MLEVHAVARRDAETGFIRVQKHLHSPEPKWKHTQSVTDFWTLFSCQDQTLKGATKREVQVLKLGRTGINKVRQKRTLLKWATFLKTDDGCRGGCNSLKVPMHITDFTCRLYDTNFITAFLLPHFQLFVSPVITSNGILYRTVPSTNTRLYE